MKKVIGILLIFVSIAMIGSGVYLMNSSKYIFETTLKGVFSYLVDGYIEMTDSLDNFNEYGKYKLTTDNTLTISGEEYANIYGDIYVDTTDEKAYFNLDSKIAGEGFVGMEALISENKIYAMLKEAMDDFYYVELDASATIETEEYDFSQLLKLEENEVAVLAKHLEDSILKGIKDKDIEKSSATVKLDGKDENTTKVSLKISGKRANEIKIDFLEAISNDNESIKALQKVNKDITKKSIQEDIDSLKKESDLSETSGIVIAFYVKGFNKLTKIEVTTYYEEFDEKAVFSASMAIDMYKNKSGKDVVVFNVELINNFGGIGSQSVQFKFEQLSDTKVSITATEDDIEKITGTFEKTDSTTELKLEWVDDSVSLGIKESAVKKNEKYIIEISLAENTTGVELVSANTLLIDEEIPSVDISDAINIEDMTEEDQQKISDFINDKLESLGLGTTEDDSQYDDVEL